MAQTDKTMVPDQSTNGVEGLSIPGLVARRRIAAAEVPSPGHSEGHPGIPGKAVLAFAASNAEAECFEFAESKDAQRFRTAIAVLVFGRRKRGEPLPVRASLRGTSVYLIRVEATP